MAAEWPHPQGVLRAENMEEIRLVCNERLGWINEMREASGYSHLRWSGLAGFANPGDLRRPHVCSHWHRLRAMVCGLADSGMFWNPDTVCAYSFGSLCYDLWGTTWWRVDDMPPRRVHHVLYDINDAYRVLEALRWLMLPLAGTYVGSTDWHGDAFYSEYAWISDWAEDDPPDWEGRWDDALTHTPRGYRTSTQTNSTLMNEKSYWYSRVWRTACYFTALRGGDGLLDYDISQITGHRLRLLGNRTVRGAETGVAVTVDGTNTAPVFGPNDLGTFGTNIGTIVAGTGSFDTIFENDSTTPPRHLRVAQPEFVNDTNPLDDDPDITTARVLDVSDVRLIGQLPTNYW